MIASIEGVVVAADQKAVVIRAHGIGYKVFSTTDTLEKIKKEKGEVVVWTYLAVRENALDLYGFLDKESLSFFELLITVSGIGPKSALSIMNIASIATIEKAISTGEIAYLTKVSGIGRKTAEKIVLELRDKIATIDDFGDSVQGDVDTIEALKALGYSQNEAQNALKKTPKEVSGPSERVKAALKILGKSRG